MSVRSKLNLIVFQTLIFSLVAALFGRLLYIQVLDSNRYKEAALSIQSRDIVTPAVRGAITDITRKEVVRQYEKMKKEGVTQKSIPKEKTRKSFTQANDDEAEMNDFIGGVYRGGGNVYRAGNVIMTEDGLIFKSGSRFIYQDGRVCQQVGSTYIREDNSVVVRAGNAFISNDGVTEKVGSNYIGEVNSYPSGSTTLRQGLPSR